MSLKVCVLASGSSGNSTYIGMDGAGLLIDAGLSCAETVRRLGAIGLALDQVRAICVSHEHQDHTAGLRVLHKRHRIPIFANAGTWEALRRVHPDAALGGSVFSNGAPFAAGGLVVEPFTVPHDAYDPVGFIVSAGLLRVGVVTDMGMATTLIRERLRGCAVLVVESNHDEQLLQDADRPWSLKQRIRGRQGHLSNAGAAAMLTAVAGPELRQVFLAHLSAECNRPHLALATIRRALTDRRLDGVQVELTYPDRVSAVWTA